MNSPTYETLIADALMEAFVGAVDRVERKFEEPGRPMNMDNDDLLRETAEEIAAKMAEYVIDSDTITAGHIIDSCPHCGKPL